MKLDFSYLQTIAPYIPPSGARWGCSFDGQRLALVGYCLCDRSDAVESSAGYFEREQSPMIFYAAVLTGVSMARAVRTFDQIAAATGTIGLTICLKGALGPREVFVRHLKKHTSNHGVILFTQGPGRWFEESEVVAAVADDRSEGVIRLAPQFEPLTERILLDEEIALIEPDRKLTPLQEAFIYGLGHWSCGQRKKNVVGNIPHPVLNIH